MPIWAKIFDIKCGGGDKCFGRGGILIFCFGFGEWFLNTRTMAWVWGATPKPWCMAEVLGDTHLSALINTPSKAGTP